MAIPKITETGIQKAIDYIKANGVPKKYSSTAYDLVIEGEKYPPKYVIAVANHLENDAEIDVSNFVATEAVNYFKTRGYEVEEKKEKFELIITKDSVKCTDEQFSMNDLGKRGDACKPLDTYLKKTDGTIIRREYKKGERKISNQTMPRIAFQLYEDKIKSLTPEERAEFPVCRYSEDSETISGIFINVEDFKKVRNTIEYMEYTYDNGSKFIMYTWNIFSPIVFVQECLKRYGEDGDQFVLIYRTKDKKDDELSNSESEEQANDVKGFMNPYSNILMQAKNIIFRGAPGTGKSYLAKKIATDIISNGYEDDYSKLSDEEKKQIEFVQFHPSYDYSDFVEGLRPMMNDDGTMGFELQDGIFKRFIDRARQNYENSLKSEEDIEKEASAREMLNSFLENIEMDSDSFKTVTGKEFFITDVNDKHIYISIPGNAVTNKITLIIDEILTLLESDDQINSLKDVTRVLNKKIRQQWHSYEYVLYKAIREKSIKPEKTKVVKDGVKNFIFIIDEINRGEISKILGELFFTIDPGYRGKAGEVSTQYSNMHSNPDEKFYIPENVYIIGTMNDIDRSVDSFDFAMRRRFRFIEVTAESSQEMLDDYLPEELKEEAIQRMDALNNEISKVEDLNENYHIGAAYFLKCKDVGFDILWQDYLKPLLQEYIQGIYDEKTVMNNLERAYNLKAKTDDEATED